MPLGKVFGVGVPRYWIVLHYTTCWGPILTHIFWFRKEISRLTLIPAARGKKRAAFVKMHVSREWLARKIWKILYGSEIVLPTFCTSDTLWLNDIFIAKLVCFWLQSGFSSLHLVHGLIRLQPLTHINQWVDGKKCMYIGG